MGRETQPKYSPEDVTKSSILRVIATFNESRSDQKAKDAYQEALNAYYEAQYQELPEESTVEKLTKTIENEERTKKDPSIAYAWNIGIEDKGSSELGYVTGYSVENRTIEFNSFFTDEHTPRSFQIAGETVVRWKKQAIISKKCK